ncbi:hypothetical protein AB6A40_007127 [Gnathostoma spinigerum]|uniref:Phorbol esters/diacylglycerol binding domain protein n=1 Tax=Gnathostoma spinigerum TaxID=75299 RepID=A0ABD6EKK9_9BILA
MVDVVFKHYDRDRDGCISQSEFEVIAGNFPFIAPFGDIDRNQDGQITKAEMKNFFVQVNKQLVELRREFKHNFHETTFLTPTLCTHCGKILWGLIRQGYKCKDCGRAVHSYCKDIVVAECRKRNGNNPFLASAASTSRPENKTLLSVRMDHRLRTVSTVSDGTSNSNNVNSAPSTSSANAKTSAQLRTLSTKLRARSETVDCYRPYSPDSPNGRPLPSLACEEVFDDETLTVAPSEAPISLERLPSS